MPFEFKLPDVGEGLTEAELLAWLVHEGDQVVEGQPLARVETDKAVVEIQSPRAGVVLKLLFSEGAVIHVGEVFIILGDSEEKPRAAAPAVGVGVVGTLEEAPPEPAPPARPPVQATPVVRRLAKELGVDLEKLTGSGPEGRITEEDVRRAAAAPAPPAGEEGKPVIKKAKKYDFYGYIEHVPFKGTRRTIARHVRQAQEHAALVAAMDEADITQLQQFIDRHRAAHPSGPVRLTLLPFLVKAVVAALKNHPYLNAALDEENDEIILKKYYNIGIATDTPDGLLVPVIKNAGDKSVLALAQEIHTLAAKARERTIDLADLQGGTFSITNYGSIRGLWGTPIINYPEVAILGVGRRQLLPRLYQGEIVGRHLLPLTLSFDHRVIDGAVASRFLQELIAYLEEPLLLL